MVQSYQIYQIQSVHNSKFWLSHEEIGLFNSLYCGLLFKNPFSRRGYEFSVWDSRGNVKHFFPPSKFYSTSIWVEVINLDLITVNFAYTAINIVAVNYKITQVVVTEGT